MDDSPLVQCQVEHEEYNTRDFVGSDGFSYERRERNILILIFATPVFRP